MVAVRWCEAEVRAFEWTNTFSNLIFAITAYVGWRLAKERGLPFEFVAAELLLIVVFVGSVLFHGTAGASWRAELLDELPMMLLAHAFIQNSCKPYCLGDLLRCHSMYVLCLLE